jgi:hypothetical protein
LGGLRRDHLLRLAALAQASEKETASAGSLRPQRRIKPGSRLLREWQGRTHEVVVTPNGYLWDGEVHASLSTVAKRITGTNWNGWRFFGLADRKERMGRHPASGVSKPLRRGFKGVAKGWPSPIPASEVAAHG